MRDVTSGSNIFRRKLCPGSHHAESTVIDEGGPEADEGTLLHPFAINPKLKRDHLSEAQKQILMVADIGTEQFVTRAAHQARSNPLEAPPRWAETRLPLVGPDREPLFTGQCDIAFGFLDVRAIAIEDFKLGFVEVEPAASNYQLASYALMWMDYMSANMLIVGINQPRGHERLTMAFYGEKELEKTRREIAAIYHAALEKNAPLIAGDVQCRNCKAKLFCPAYAQKFEALALRPEAQTIATLDNQTLTRFAIAVKTAAAIRRPVMEELTRRIEAGEIDGWELKETGEMRELTDVVGAYQELKSYFENIGGFTGQRFTECTEIQWGKLTDLIKTLTGFTHARSAVLVNELLNPYIARRKKAPTPTQTK